MMSERAIEISETYTPGKNLGKTRTITVDKIPAVEVTLDNESEVLMDFPVFERVGKLIKRAFRANDLPHQRITYSTETTRAGRRGSQRSLSDGDN